ncbi:MAG: hypothetical protein ACO2PM_19775 [Pyrobaculum sp.]|jgi:hypothetical protein
MRTYLLIIALAALATAQATQLGIATQIINLPDTIKTTIDDISYSLVKQRTELPQITVPLPAASYKDYGNIKLIVIAIPYSPEEDPNQAIKDAIKKLIDTSKNFNQRVSEAIKELLSIRSVFYPYETFRVRLIFIIFVHTQTLIDYAIEASANLLNSGNSQDRQSGAALYTNSIMEILNAKYKTWQNSNKLQLENKIDRFILQTSRSGDIITFTGQVNGKTVLEFSVNVTASKNTVCKISSSVGQINESFTDELANEIRTTLPKLDLEDLQRVFAGKKDINNIVNDFNTEIDNYYSTIINNEKTKLSGNIKEHINSLFNNTIICSGDDCDCENNKEQMINSILQQSSSLESWLKNSYKRMLENIDGTINNCLGVVNDIKSSLLPNCEDDSICNMIRDTLEDFGNTVAGEIGSVVGRCVGQYLGEIVESGINSVVSTIPGVNLAYILANGIVGALQNQVTITGQIISEPVLVGGLRAFKVYSVSNRIACYSREIRDISGQDFVSEPSTSEAIFAAIKGFISAVTQLYGGGLGKAVDLIPIIRTVDMPTDGYFMFTATPGVSVLKIDNLNARSIIDKFKKDIKNKIQENLAESYNKGSRCELYMKINEKVKNVLGTTNLGNRAALYQEAYGNDYDYNNRESDTSTLTLNLYFVVIPPYMAGTRVGSGYNYTLVADLFGVLRSFLFPAIGDVRRQIINSTFICPVSTVHASPGFGSAVESACVNIVRSAVGVVSKAMSRVINNLFKYEIDPKDQISCSLKDVLAYGVKAAINAAMDAIKTEITDTISERLIDPLSERIERSVCSWLGDQVGNQIEEGLSSLLEMLFDLYGTSGFQSQKMSYSFRASYDSDSNRLKEAFCRLVGNPKIITYLGLHVVRIFDAAEEGLYVPSYFLSAYPIQFKESPTAMRCYSVVVSPYYIYRQPPLPTREKEVKSLLIDALEVIRDNDNLKTGLLNFLRDKYVQTKILWIFTWRGNAVKDNNKVACNPRGIRILPPEYNPYLDFNECWSGGDLRWTIDSLQLDQLSQNDMQFLRGLLMQGSRMIEVPVLAGINKYFDAFKVYPAMAVREVGNPNPYYFVVPYSTPARELFVLGTVGNVVVYDGGLRGSGDGGKPFLYYDVSR